MRGVVIAGEPDFVEEELTQLVGGAVEVVLETAFFLARGPNEGTELGFEEKVLPFAGAHEDDEGDGVLGKLDSLEGGNFPVTRPASGRGLALGLGHNGGDCTANKGNGKEKRPGMAGERPFRGEGGQGAAGESSSSLRPASRLSKLRRALRTKE